MPTYEYACPCGHRFEKFEKISAKPTKSCPECGKKKAKRVISGGAGVIFKGDGFYCNTYGKKAKESRQKQGEGS